MESNRVWVVECLYDDGSWRPDSDFRVLNARVHDLVRRVDRLEAQLFRSKSTALRVRLAEARADLGLFRDRRGERWRDVI